MEEVPGIRGQIPPLAGYPESSVKASLPQAEWEACLDTWLFSIEVRLRLPEKEFARFRWSQDASGVPFLVSFLRATSDRSLASAALQKERLLQKRAYMLLRRLLLVTEVPVDYDAAKFTDVLADASIHYASISDWRLTLKTTWKRNQTQMRIGVEAWEKLVSKQLSAEPDSKTLLDSLRRMNALVRASADVGLILMTGSDHLETLMEAYSKSAATFPQPAPLQRVLTEHIFYCLRSLMSDGSSQGSLLLDHLFFMKSEAERLSKSKPLQATLCSQLVCSTSFLRHLAADDSAISGKRGQGLLVWLTSYRQNTWHLHPPSTGRRQRGPKGKGKADAAEEMHIHKASQISQVHDLFPDLSNSYILKLLDHFLDDTEAVVAALLEPDSLPSALRDTAPGEEVPADIAGPAHDLAPRSTPPFPAQRRNVFDGDDFDKLHISADQLHKGRKEITLGDAVAEGEHNQRKAAIMSALAAFDSDDDERDDTYDIADVGGTVDSTLDTDIRPRPERRPDQNPHEESLYRAWKERQDLFARDSKTRASKVRQDLKRETEMSDEQLEGWAIMLKKDPKLQDRLEKKYATARAFSSSQSAVISSKWRQEETPEDSEEGEGGTGGAGGGRRSGQAQIRGNRVWGRGRGGGGAGSTAGPSGDAATQAARRRKEQGKGRGGASHNRREGRDRKMGRGMGGPAIP